MASLQDILLAINSLNQAVNNIGQQITPITSITSQAASSVGALSFTSSEPTTFLVVRTSSGGTYRVPGYNNF